MKIENGEKRGTQKVTVVTDGSSDLTKEDAIKSLGSHASRYVVVNWAKEGEEAPAPTTSSAGKETTYVAGMTGVT